MADIAHATRIEPLAGRVGGAAGVSLTPAAPANRVSLRAGSGDAKALSDALGLDLPMMPKTSGLVSSAMIRGSLGKYTTGTRASQPRLHRWFWMYG